MIQGDFVSKLHTTFKLMNLLCDVPVWLDPDMTEGARPCGWAEIQVNSYICISDYQYRLHGQILKWTVTAQSNCTLIEKKKKTDKYPNTEKTRIQMWPTKNNPDPSWFWHFKFIIIDINF